MQVLLFGSIAEKAQSSAVSIDAATMDELRQALIARIPELAAMRYAIAVDRRIVHQDIALTGSEEIAVLPPFAGG